MRKRNRRGTGARARRSKRRPSRRAEPAPGRSAETHIPARRSATRRQTRQSKALSTRRRVNRLSRNVESSRGIEGSRRRRNKLQARPRKRRNALRTLGRAPLRLSPALVQVQRPYENASDKQTKRRLCTRKKEARRGVILATGHGGINGKKNYRRHQRCR